MTPEQQAAIIYFKTGAITPNELLKKFGHAASQEQGADTLLVPYGKPDGYSYVSLDQKTHVNISRIFPSQLLKEIAKP